jgi:hypothetical protein
MRWRVTYNVDDDARDEEALLVLVWRFLSTFVSFTCPSFDSNE